MQILLEELEEIAVPNFYDGNGVVFTKSSMQSDNKVVYSRLPVGSSIGMHEHTANNAISYVLSGTGKAIWQGKEETLAPGICHYCPKGTSHSILNTGTEDLIFFTVAWD